MRKTQDENTCIEGGLVEMAVHTHLPFFSLLLLYENADQDRKSPLI